MRRESRKVGEETAPLHRRRLLRETTIFDWNRALSSSRAEEASNAAEEWTTSRPMMLPPGEQRMLQVAPQAVEMGTDVPSQMPPPPSAATTSERRRRRRWGRSAKNLSRIVPQVSPRTLSLLLLALLVNQLSASSVSSPAAPPWKASPPLSTTMRRDLVSDARDGTNGDGTDDGYTLWTYSDEFATAFTSVLVAIATVRLFLAWSVHRNRSDPALRLAQPHVLCLYVVLGSWVVASCRLLLPPADDNDCRMREPLLLVPLTLAGSILAARIWRVRTLLTPVLRLGASDRSITARGEGGDGDSDSDRGRRRSRNAGPSFWRYVRRAKSRHRALRERLMSFLTHLAEPWLIGRLLWSSLSDAERRRKREAIKRTVPVSSLLRLALALSSPQLVLQTLELVVPPLRAERELVRVEGPWENADVVRQECTHGGFGASFDWGLLLGVLFAFIPHAFALFLSAGSDSDGLPKVLDEHHAVASSGKAFMVVLFVAYPSMAVSQAPEARTLLATGVVLAATLPPTWSLVWSKLTMAWAGEGVEVMDQLLSRAGRPPGWRRSNAHPSDTQDGSGDEEALRRERQMSHEKTARLALTVGKMYQDVGMAQKSAKMFDEALAVWKFERDRTGPDIIGGFTESEIRDLTARDLELVVQLLIAKGRVMGTFSSIQNRSQKNAAQSWIDALEIFEHAPASEGVADRSIIFPCFSGIFVFMKGGKIEQDAECSFEQDLVRQFVKQTCLHGDPVHYTRALAMKCEVMARLGHYDDAMEAFGTLKEIYVPEKHSDDIAKEYGTDRSAQAFSQSALWYMQMGKTTLALSSCEYVIETLLPKMDPTNTLNSCEMLLPVIRILKWRGQAQRMRKLFDTYVVQNFHKHHGKDGVTPCKSVMKPMLLLLDVCDDKWPKHTEIEEAASWMAVEENGVSPEMLDSIYTNLCWSMHSLVAEICLCLAKRLIECDAKDKLIMKGLNLARKADKKMKDEDGNVKLPIAHEVHAPILEELEKMAKEQQLFYVDRQSLAGSCKALSRFQSESANNGTMEDIEKNKGGKTKAFFRRLSISSVGRRASDPVSDPGSLDDQRKSYRNLFGIDTGSSFKGDLHNSCPSDLDYGSDFGSNPGSRRDLMSDLDTPKSAMHSSLKSERSSSQRIMFDDSWAENEKSHDITAAPPEVDLRERRRSSDGDGSSLK